MEAVEFLTGMKEKDVQLVQDLLQDFTLEREKWNHIMVIITFQKENEQCVEAIDYFDLDMYKSERFKTYLKEMTVNRRTTDDTIFEDYTYIPYGCYRAKVIDFHAVAFINGVSYTLYTKR